MALVCLHYSDFFEENLLSGKIKGTVLKGEWNVPLGEELFVYLAPGNAEISEEDRKIGTAKIISCRSMKVNELSDNEAKICAYENKEALQQGVKHWHRCSDSDIITFIEFEFKKISEKKF